MCGQTTFSLIDIKTRLVPHAHINTVLHSVFHDFNDRGRFFAGKYAYVLLKPFALAGGRVRSVKHAFGSRSLHQSVNDFCTVGLHGRTLKLRHHPITVHIGHQPRNAVGLSKDQSAGIGTFQ